MLAATLVTIVSGKATPLSVHVINKANIPIVIKHDVNYTALLSTTVEPIEGPYEMRTRGMQIMPA